MEPIAAIGRRRRRMRRRLAVAVITTSLAVPGVAAAYPAGSAPTGTDATSGSAITGGSGQTDSGVIIRRDGSAADAFVADVDGSPASSADGDDFAWGDAAIGAGAALGLVALAGGGLALRRRHAPAAQSVQTAS
jgi:hypothetical protein